MIFAGSRYQNTGTYAVKKADGQVVTALKPPLPGAAIVRGYLRRRAEAQRLDIVANYYLKDATAFWKLCDANNAIRPDELTETVGRRLRITMPDGIPAGTGGR